jgi:hypothetical protein
LVSVSAFLGGRPSTPRHWHTPDRGPGLWWVPGASGAGGGGGAWFWHTQLPGGRKWAPRGTGAVPYIVAPYLIRGEEKGNKGSERQLATTGIGSACGPGASTTPGLRGSARDAPRVRKYRRAARLGRNKTAGRQRAAQFTAHGGRASIRPQREAGDESAPTRPYPLAAHGGPLSRQRSGWRLEGRGVGLIV